jgi:hypothetical protein
MRGFARLLRPALPCAPALARAAATSSCRQAARTSQAEAEAAAARKGFDPALAALLAAGLTATIGLLAILWDHPKAGAQLKRDCSQAEATRQFERRRIDAIKLRLLSRLPGPAAAEDGRLARPDALRVLECMHTKAGLYMVVGPQGEGKTTLAAQFVAAHPHALYVDLQEGSMDKAVRAVAAALGYDLADSAEEASVRLRGHRLPDLHTAQLSTDMYGTLLAAFERACVELRAEGMLAPGCCPALVLDHANRPLRRSGGSEVEFQALPQPPLLDALSPAAAAQPVSAGTNLMYTTVEIGHRFANDSVASLVMVSSGLLQELDAWRRAGWRDSVCYIRVAPFSDADAASLLARRILASRAGCATCQPTPRILADTQRHYASTLATITATLGNRARWLVQALAHAPHAPLADAELAARGVPIPAAYLPYLYAALRVDPDVWLALQGLIEARIAGVDALLSVSSAFTLPSSPSLDPGGATRFAERVLAVDAALRALLHAPQPHSGLQRRFFAAASHVLRRLSEQHVIFYNHDTRFVELESPLMHRVASALLGSQDHQLSMALLRQLLAWQAAAQAKAELEQQLAAEGAGAASAWFRPARVAALVEAVDAARRGERQARLDAEATRSALQGLRQ